MTPPANMSDVHELLGAELLSQGFARNGNTYSRARGDQTFLLFDVQRSRKSSYPGVAASIVVDGGLGTTAQAGDLRTSSLRSLSYLVGDGDGCAQMCRTHNEITTGFTAAGAPGERVAMLLGLTVKPAWRNAPDVLWYRTRSDVAAWAAFLRSQLPGVLARLNAAWLDSSRPALGLRLA